jgi:serine/threonine-protein kinase
MTDLINRVLGDRYKIIEPIGSGGAGRVFKGVHLKLKMNIAIKAIPKLALQATSIMGEVELLKHLQHQGLPLVYDVEEDEAHLFIIQELIVGHTLQSRLESDGPLLPSEAIVFMERLLPIVQYLHMQEPRPIIHRDIKPDNIMLSTGGGLKLIDFGIAREYKASESADTFYLGTRGYAAPEQFGRGQSDVRTDIYALGMVLYVLLTGDTAPNLPMGKITLESLNPSEKQLGLHLEKIILKATQFMPNQRYESVVAFRNELAINRFPETALLGEHSASDHPKTDTIARERGQDYKKRTIVAVQGARSGVGVTHLCLMLAFTLKKIGYTVTLVHEGSQSEYGAIYQYYEGDDRVNNQKSQSFVMDGVEITALSTEKGVGQVLAGNRDFYIVDCGTKLKSHPEWIRAHVCIGIYSSALWQMHYNQGFAELYAQFPHMTHLFSTCDGKLLDAVLKSYDWRPKKFLKIPFHGNPFKANEESMDFVETLLDLKQRKKYRFPFVGGIN